MENLSDFYIQKAKTDLGEDAEKTEKSINLFYSWLNKHPFITSCNIDSSHVMHFLRARSYNMNNVFESFNKLAIFQQKTPQLFNFQNYQQLLDIYDKGPFLPMRNRDSEGRRILIFRHKLLETMNVDFQEILKLNYLTLKALVDEPETQICGIIVIMDFQKLSLKYFKVVNFSLLGKLLSLSDCLPVRFQQIIIYGLPAIGNSVLKIFKSFLSEELKSKMIICKNFEELSNVVDVTKLTDEYGGTDNADECLKYLKENVKEAALFSINYLNSIKIDEEKMKIYENKK